MHNPYPRYINNNALYQVWDDLLGQQKNLVRGVVRRMLALSANYNAVVCVSSGLSISRVLPTAYGAGYSCERGFWNGGKCGGDSKPNKLLEIPHVGWT